MNTAAVDQIAKAILYEGYMLDPYRPSAVKNRQRFNFGVVYPQLFSEAQKWADPCTMHVECLVQGSIFTRLEVSLRCLQLTERSVEEAVRVDNSPVAAFRPVKSLTVDGQTFHSWQEAVERDCKIPSDDLSVFHQHATQWPFVLAGAVSEETLTDAAGVPVGRVVRVQEAIHGSVSIASHPVAPNVFKIVVRVDNFTPIDNARQAGRDYALMRSLVSAHIVLGVEAGGFVSLLDPPERLRSLAEGCKNQGAFPVLVGEPGRRDTMLASPIILYDYPQIAPESAGDLFDSTEIDEILSLRIMTMTDDEKREMRESDERAREMLERTENMPAEHFMKLHGALRGLRPVKGEAS